MLKQKRKTEKRPLYRYVAKDGSYATRWRRLPPDGMVPPTRLALAKLGEGYSGEIKNQPAASAAPASPPRTAPRSASPVSR